MLLLYPDHYKQPCEIDTVHIVYNFLDICLINQYIVRSRLISHFPKRKKNNFFELLKKITTNLISFNPRHFLYH